MKAFPGCISRKSRVEDGCLENKDPKDLFKTPTVVEDTYLLHNFNLGMAFNNY